ncbi:MAG: methyltransferase [Ilumatobacteraceae bacterium]
MTDDVVSRSTEIAGYDAVYRLRRSRSTMADDAVNWITGAVGQWMRSSRRGAPFRILSVGCGDGSLDLPLLAAARRHGPVEYVGCDVNADSLAVFATALGTADEDPGLVTSLVHGPFQVLADDAHFDLVLLAHVLYYVDDPVAVVRTMRDERCSLDGRVVVIHSARRGVPSTVEAALGSTSFVTGDEIAAGLRAAGMGHVTAVVPGRLCVDDAIVDSPLGRALLGFIVEREPLDDGDRDRLVAAMVASAVDVDGSLFLPEDLMTIEVRSLLRPLAEPAGGAAVDPIRDYHVLVESFDWPERLASVPAPDGAPSALLDVGCGTGRWLRVLASTFPSLTSPGRTPVVYDRVDPSGAALAPNATIAATMFTVGDTWCEGVETAEIPRGRYGLIWSVHALYGMPVVELEQVLRRLVDGLTVGGVLIVVLGDPGSFYLEAKPRLVGGEAFTSSRDVLAALEALGLSAEVTTIGYVEAFPVTEEERVRRYVWHESIGNSYLPAGLSGGDVPGLPEGEWWDSHRRGDRYEFPQSVSVIVIGRD